MPTAINELLHSIAGRRVLVQLRRRNLLEGEKRAEMKIPKHARDDFWLAAMWVVVTRFQDHPLMMTIGTLALGSQLIYQLFRLGSAIFQHVLSLITG